MKFKINSTDLKKSLSRISPAIPSRAIIPINLCVLVSVDGKDCTLTGSNSNLTIEVNCKLIEDEGQFEMVIPFKELNNITGRLTGKEVEIENVKGVIKVKSNGKKWDVGNAEDVTNFSKGKPFEPTFSIPVEDDTLYYMQKALTCTANEGHPAYADIWLHIEDKKFNIVSADGQQIFRYQQTAPDKVKFKGLVNRPFVSALNDISDAVIESDESNLRVKNDNVSVTVTMSEGSLPAYEPYFKENNPNCVIDKDEFLAALEDIFVYDSVLGYHLLKLSFGEGEVSVQFDQPETSQFYKTTVSAEHKVSVKDIYFNAKFMKNLISMFPSSTGKINMQFRDEKGIVTISSEDDNITSILIPLAIN